MNDEMHGYDAAPLEPRERVRSGTGLVRSLLFGGLLVSVGCAGTTAPPASSPSSPSDTALIPGAPEISVTTAERREFRPLSPDDKEGKGPTFAVVFGDVTKRVPTGLLVKLPADADPGPHTHSSDYHGLILSGAIHHFVPGKGEGATLTAGSTWFAPRDVVHENHCEAGAPCLVYLVFHDGFDIKPVKATP